LVEAARRVRAQGWEIVNLDSTIVAQQPRLAAHRKG
jgi:2-C-methyl-D-erythritol 2,4-cyclodiphosphate synthase